MKKIILFTLLMFPFLSKGADSVEVKKMVAIKTDLIAVPIPLLFHHRFYCSVTGEINIFKKQSIQLCLLYYEFNPSYRLDNTLEIVPEYKYYFDKLGKGFFVGAYCKYDFSKKTFYLEYDSDGGLLKPHEILGFVYTSKSVGLGPLIGFQQNIGRHWLMEIIGGCGVKKNVSVKKELIGPSSTYTDNTKFDGIYSLNIGYRF